MTMRVLFVANPEKAHLLAMVPLAWALRTAGHEVRVAGQPAFADLITQAGLTAVPVGRDADLWDLLPRDPRYPPWTWKPAYGLEPPYDVADHPEKATWQYLSEGYAEVLRTWHKPACFAMIGPLVGVRPALAARPDPVGTAGLRRTDRGQGVRCRPRASAVECRRLRGDPRPLPPAA